MPDSRNRTGASPAHLGQLPEGYALESKAQSKALAILIKKDNMRRVKHGQVRTFSEHFPEVEPGCLIAGTGQERLQRIWDSCLKDTPVSQRHNRKRWLY
jgi:hypothetical protein